MNYGGKEIKIFTTKCANCGHPQIRHMKQPRPHDEQRWKILAKEKPVYTNCQDCIDEGIKCKGFKSK